MVGFDFHPKLLVVSYLPGFWAQRPPQIGTLTSLGSSVGSQGYIRPFSQCSEQFNHTQKRLRMILTFGWQLRSSNLLFHTRPPPNPCIHSKQTTRATTTRSCHGAMTNPVMICENLRRNNDCFIRQTKSSSHFGLKDSLQGMGSHAKL